MREFQIQSNIEAKGSVMHSKDEFVSIVLPYRMKAIDVFRVALKLELSFESPKSMEMYFGEKLTVTGLSTAWTNPVIESGIMHCRACLEFLGLREDAKNPLTLKSRAGKRQDNYGIEDWGLECISPEQAVAPYEGPKDEAEKALASVIHCANKGVAHTTASQMVVEEDRHLYGIAARGIPTLLINHFYIPLGIQPPEYKIVAKEQ
jgi:hypothetical protein